MKMEIRIWILSIITGLMIWVLFTYCSNLIQKEYYVLQIGIYEKEENRDEKLEELKKINIDGSYYFKNNKYYVFAYISDNKKEVEDFQNETDIKGIIKKYYTFIYDKNDFLETLKAGDV